LAAGLLAALRVAWTGPSRAAEARDLATVAAPLTDREGALVRLAGIFFTSLSLQRLCARCRGQTSRPPKLQAPRIVATAARRQLPNFALRRALWRLRSLARCPGFQTRHCSSPCRKMSRGRSSPMNTILLPFFSPAAQAGPRSLPMSWCTPWNTTLRSVPFM